VLSRFDEMPSSIGLGSHGAPSGAFGRSAQREAAEKQVPHPLMTPCIRG
jgi:hypothetical protein